MHKESDVSQQAIVGTALGAIIAMVFGGSAPSIWYLPITAILVALLLPYWRARSRNRLPRITYSLVFAFCCLPAIIFVLAPALPIMLDEHPSLTWWGVPAAEIELFTFWLLTSGGIYVSR
ncbi:hypothetical protein [Microbulbifer halophilus]|uniref:Apolipoprotein N-acyltransferase n=1 Tax=Microbulbifer halophilus TaxID=453963 RepID=A0ABW5EI92_9GAMM|nr:hypothetical protein [Microbulbifer halophilus]MCW8127827.1 hypothetical protein [Microbulbifer halophilus]